MKTQIKTADKKITNYTLRTANPQNVIFYILALFLQSASLFQKSWF